MFIIIIVIAFFGIVFITVNLKQSIANTEKPLTGFIPVFDQLAHDVKSGYGLDDYSPFTYDEIRYSPSKEYCVSYYGGSITDSIFEPGQLALIKKGVLVFTLKIENPDYCQVSNDGIIVCVNQPDKDILSDGYFLVFDITNVLLFEYHATAYIGESGISSDSNYCVFTTGMSITDDSNKIIIVDLKKKEILNKIDGAGQYHTDKIKVNSKGKTISLINYNKQIRKIDFKGKEIKSKQIPS